MSPPEQGQRMRARISGRVQGVGFRWWVVRQADFLGLTGWVMNDPDERSVELLAEGDPIALDTLERLLHSGPPGAWVDAVDTAREAASGEFSRFSINRP
jgi:acylphosphatase